MPSFKLYEALGLQRDASGEQIKSAYKKLAIVNHPDKGGDVEKFKEISAAYNILSDEGKKQEYDQFGDEGSQGQMQHDINPHDLFAHLFGGMGGIGGMHFNMNMNMGGHNNRRANNHVHEMHIQLHEAYFGAHKGVRIQMDKPCFSCQNECPSCQGLGRITQLIRNGIFTQMIQQGCDACNGSGRVTRSSKDCKKCKGTGSYKEENKIDVKIKKGVPSDGFQVVADGLGEQARTSKETSGDLIIKVVVDDDSVFKRQGDHLSFISKPHTTLTLAESMIGKQIDIPHFCGKITVNTRMFGIVEPGKTYRIPGKGMPLENDNNIYGDLLLNFTVVYPSSPLSDESIVSLSAVFQKVGI